MNFKRKATLLLTCVFSTSIIMSTGIAPLSAMATSTADLQNQINALQNQLDSIGASKQQEASYQKTLNKQIDLLNEQMDVYQAQLDALSNQENQQLTEVLSVRSEIDTTNQQIESINNTINELEAQKEQTVKQLEERIRCEYMSDSLSWWEVLLSSQDLASFFSNFEYMKCSAEQSQQLKEDLNEQTEQISEQKDQLQQEVATLSTKEQEAQQKLDEVEQTEAAVSGVQNDLQQTANEINGKLEQSTDKSKQLSSQYQQTQAEKDKAAKELKEAQAEADKDLNDYNDNHGGQPSSPNASTGFICPLPAGSYYVSQPYGGSHTGVDLAASSGTPIYASKSGTVVTAQYWDGHSTGGMQSYGNMVQIDHGDGSSTLYAHCSKICVSKGQKVSQGQVIGYVGTTGNSTGNHLHFEMKINGSRVNPLNYI